MDNIGRDARPNGWKVWERQLPFIRARYENGNPLAILDGISACEGANCPLPEWLNEAIRAFYSDALRGNQKGKQGRSNTSLGRYREGLKLFARKEAVWGVLQWQDSIHCFASMPKRAVELWIAGQLDLYGNTFEDAVEIATIGLEGTFAEASFETVRKAHFKPWPFGDQPLAFWGSLERFGLMDHRLVGTKLPPHILKLLRETPFPKIDSAI